PIRRRRKPVALSRAAGPDWPEVPIPSKILRANALPPRKRAILPSIRGGDALVEVVTDSAANLPADLAAELGIRVVPLHLTIGDSTNASMAEGFVAVEAARMARDGATTDDVVARAKEVASRSRILATIDTFEFLKRSGRVRRAQAYAATMLNIKPVFRFLDGDAEGVARPRTRSRALERIVKETVDETRGRAVHLAAFHALAEPDAKELV